jgi:hypothetical protein
VRDAGCGSSGRGNSELTDYDDYYD